MLTDKTPTEIVPHELLRTLQQAKETLIIASSRYDHAEKITKVFNAYFGFVTDILVLEKNVDNAIKLHGVRNVFTVKGDMFLPSCVDSAKNSFVSYDVIFVLVNNIASIDYENALMVAKQFSQTVYFVNKELIVFNSYAGVKNEEDIFQYALRYSLFPPKRMRIESTNACNAHCAKCPRDEMTRSIGFMEHTLYTKIVDEAACLGISQIHLHNFGEPLLDDDLENKITYAKQKGIHDLWIVTNGSLLTEKRSRSLIRSGLSTIVISIDAATEHTYALKRAGLDYASVVQNILSLVNEKLKQNSGIKIVLNYVIGRDNEGEKELFFETWKEKVDQVNFEKEYDWHKFYEKDATCAKKPICYYPWKYLNVLWNGDVSLCCIDYDGRIALGSLVDSSIFELWNSDVCNEMRNDFMNGNMQKYPFCETCRNGDKRYNYKKLF